MEHVEKISRLIFFDFSGKMRVALKLSAFLQWEKVQFGEATLFATKAKINFLKGPEE